MASRVLIVGAGIAGLAAASRLSRAGLDVNIVEARDRIGGRIWTLRDPEIAHPVELGAEFVHGKPAEIWRYHQPGTIDIDEGDGSNWCVEQGRLDSCNFFEQVEKIMDRLKDYCGPDISFQQFLDHNGPIDDSIRRRALNYVMGFHGADPRDAGIASLARDTFAAEKIEGDRAFRICQGYGALLDLLLDDCELAGVTIHLRQVVERIDWSGPVVRIETNHQGRKVEFTADLAIVTLPVGVLRLRPEEVGYVEFAPPLAEKRGALETLAAGHVMRISLVFSDRFWGEEAVVRRKGLADLHFLFSDDPWFPNWWTRAPKPVPLLTGWSPALRSEPFAGQSLEFITEHALQSLSRLLSLSVDYLEEKLVSAYSHDWITDPFSRGAYSYARVGGLESFQQLAQPLGGKLYFAGEATDSTGHHGTVHGAIASGDRVAGEILRQLAGRSALRSA